jgi:hypothetical protein
MWSWYYGHNEREEGGVLLFRDLQVFFRDDIDDWRVGQYQNIDEQW